MTSTIFLAPYVRSFFEDYLTFRRNLSRNTICSYRDALKLFLQFATVHLRKSATKMLITDLDESLILTFLTDLEQTRRNSIQTRNHRLGALQSLCEYIGSREPTVLDHCHRIATIPQKRGAPLPEIHYLEKAEINAILEAVARQTPRGRRDYALLLFMYNTGARVQEVADTRISWLTLSAPYKVALLGKGRKWRTCPLWESTAQCVRLLLEERRLKADGDEYLFVNHQIGRAHV